MVDLPAAFPFTTEYRTLPGSRARCLEPRWLWFERIHTRFRQARPAADGGPGMVRDELRVGVQNANVVPPGHA